MNRLWIIGAFIVAGFIFVSPDVSAGGRADSSPDTCTAVVGNKTTSGDAWYGPTTWNWCRQGFLNNVADVFDMEKKFWDDGFGWNDACNTDRPFARLVTPRVALEVSSASPQLTGDIDRSRPILDWILLWAVRQIGDTRARCGFGEDAAASAVGGDRVKLNVLNRGDSELGFFYGFDVPGRAGILVHEAQHLAGAPGHGSDGRDQRYSDNGAFSAQIGWLMLYARNATKAPRELRCAAQDFANTLLTSRFVEPPGFDIDVPACEN